MNVPPTICIPQIVAVLKQIFQLLSIKHGEEVTACYTTPLLLTTQHTHQKEIPKRRKFVMIEGEVIPKTLLMSDIWITKKHQAVKAGSLHLLGWGGGKSCDLTWFSFYFNLSLYISALFVQSLSGFLYMYIISVIFFFCKKQNK